MKYFTSAWWGLQQRADPDPVPVYRAYYEAIRGNLPPDLVAAHDMEPLHDGTLHFVELDGESRVLRLELTVYEEKRSRPLTLVYSGVVSFQTVVEASGQIRGGGPNAVGSLGYQEVEVVGAGQFEHRLLFENGIELRMRFSEFELQHA